MKKLLMVAGITGALMLAASPARAKVEITSTVISGGNLRGSIELSGNEMYELTTMAMFVDHHHWGARPAPDPSGKKALGPEYILNVSFLDPATSKVKYATFTLYPFAAGGPLTSVDHRVRLNVELASGFYLADPSITELLARVGVGAPGDFGAGATEAGTGATETGTSGVAAAVVSIQAGALVGDPMVALSLGALLAAIAISSMLRRSRREPASA